ncbi:hypothetical protein GKE82_14090 [Conexibacter sp. W3-3-2]|uniref:hypothetical protein n=1 Tax=Solirubrobacterales TaxID=588673 RepID=UPI000D1F6FF2|nr:MULTISPECIES: hypothetical protein [Solirubrobacterales]MTD45385.1 hypothetical protein [Conexibacter sp. W3-3-2]
MTVPPLLRSVPRARLCAFAAVAAALTALVVTTLPVQSSPSRPALLAAPTSGTVDGLAVQAAAAEQRAALPLRAGGGPRARTGRSYLVVKVTLVNRTDRDLTVSDERFSAFAGGAALPIAAQAADAVLYSPWKPLLHEQLGPGERLTGKLVLDAPARPLRDAVLVVAGQAAPLRLAVPLARR